MKRLWSTPQYTLRQHRIRQKRRRRREHTPIPTRRSYRRVRHPLLDERIHIDAPHVLEIFAEPKAATELCISLRQNLRQPNRRVFLDLSAVMSFSMETLLPMLSAMRRPYRNPSSHISGNIPDDASVASEFKESGFFDGFARPPGDLPKPSGLILTEHRKRVFATVAAKLVDFAVIRAGISKSQADACSKNLIELMTNTHDHAGRRVVSKSSTADLRHRWFASVYCVEQTAHFGFFDPGKGILRTAPVKHWWSKSLGKSARCKALERVFRGELGSATAKKGRGYGLPRMRQDVGKRLMQDAFIVTGDVYGDIKALDFQSIGVTFPGTLFRWKVTATGAN